MRDLLEAWADIEAVDHHCHPLWRFTHPVTAADLRMLFTEALDGAMARHVPSTAVYHDALRRIAQELDCAATEEAILRARSGREPAAHAEALLRRSRTGTMLLDHGFASGETFSIAEHADLHSRLKPVDDRLSDRAVVEQPHRNIEPDSLGIYPGDDLRFRITPALERVLDQSRDVVLVFDDENPGFCHAPRRSVPAERVARMSKVLIVG